MTARSDMSRALLSSALRTCSSLLTCHLCLSWHVFSLACSDLSEALSDFLFPSTSKSASSSSSWSLSTWILDVSQSWYFIFSNSSSSRSSPLLDRAHVENAFVFSSLSKSLNLCMSFSILLLASSSLSFGPPLFMSPFCIHSRTCARSLWSLLIDLFRSSPNFSLWAPLALLACSQTDANSSMPSSTFLSTTSTSFCSLRAAAAVIPAGLELPPRGRAPTAESGLWAPAAKDGPRGGETRKLCCGA
mmetsp:Transcript_93674/g.254241  ORF Transcript_93674/g.254241 Transcript_93674/m.254241 type:complete len:246 (-) Transcript_93674:1-738(-)